MNVNQLTSRLPAGDVLGSLPSLGLNSGNESLPGSICDTDLQKMLRAYSFPGSAMGENLPHLTDHVAGSNTGPSNANFQDSNLQVFPNDFISSFQAVGVPSFPAMDSASIASHNNSASSDGLPRSNGLLPEHARYLGNAIAPPITKQWLDESFPDASQSLRKRVWTISQLSPQEREAADRLQLHSQSEKLAQLMRAVNEIHSHVVGASSVKSARFEFKPTKEIEVQLRSAIEKIYGNPTRADYELDLRILLNGLHENGLVPREFSFVANTEFTRAVEKAASWVSTSTVKRILKEYCDMNVEHISNLLFPGYDDKENERSARAALMRWYNGLGIEEQVRFADALSVQNITNDLGPSATKRQKGSGGTHSKNHARDQFGRGLSSRIPFMCRFSLFLKNHLGNLSDTDKGAFIANCLAEDRKKFKATRSTVASLSRVGVPDGDGDISDTGSDRGGNDSEAVHTGRPTMLTQ